MTTHQAKGIIPEDHYLAIGVNYAQLGPAYRVVPESDVILAVGTRLLIRDLHLSNAQKIIHVDADPEEIGRNYPTEIGIEADAKEALNQLLQHLRAVGHPNKSRRQEIEGYKKAFMDEVRGLAPQQVSVIDTIRNQLDDRAIVVGGITNIAYWGNVAYPVSHPRTYLTIFLLCRPGLRISHGPGRQGGPTGHPGGGSLRRRRLHVQPPGALHGGKVRHQCSRTGI